MENIQVPPGLLIPFLGAIQASISALLTISIGVAAAQWGLLGSLSSKQISRACINIFLPLLLISNLGGELHVDAAQRYIPIMIWALLCSLLSFFIGKMAVHMLHLPLWTTTALAFNNSTSLPLLLLQSLKKSGVLSRLVGNKDHLDAIERARSYFLVFAVVNNILSFSMGTPELKGFSEDAPDDVGERVKRLAADLGDQVAQPFRQLAGSDEENPGSQAESQQTRVPDDEEEADERTSLLPHHAETVIHQTKRHITGTGKKFYRSLPGPLQTVIDWVACFVGPPSIGAAIGATIGLTPALHRLFFNDPLEGGFFNAWLTTPIQNAGELFVTLQIVVVGVKLSLSLRRLKEGQGGGELDWRTVTFVALWRLIALPAISIPVIWAVASRTSALSVDPILWFTMMMMPVGPPAMRLLAIADVNHMEEEEKMSIARFLTVLYAVVPLITLTVAGALRASEAVCAQANKCSSWGSFRSMS